MRNSGIYGRDRRQVRGRTSDTFYPAALFIGNFVRPWRSADTSKQVSQSTRIKVSDVRLGHQHAHTFISTDCGGSQPNAMGWPEATHRVCCRIKRMRMLIRVRELV